MDWIIDNVNWTIITFSDSWIAENLTNPIVFRLWELLNFIWKFIPVIIFIAFFWLIYWLMFWKFNKMKDKKNKDLENK